MKRAHTVHKGDRITQRWLAQERAAKVAAELKAERDEQMRQWDLAHMRNGCPYDPADDEPYHSDAAW